MSRRRVAILASLVGLSALVLAMAAVRVVYTGTDYYSNLVWNLFLAWIPFGLAVYAYDGYRKGMGRLQLWAAAGLWLLFFPNALYIVTDFKWLRDWAGAPIWYDILLVSAAAWGGLLLGFTSLYLMQRIVGRAFGAVQAWAFALATLALGLVRRLPRTLRALELMGRLHEAAADRAGRPAAPRPPAGPPTGPRRDGALHRVPRDELPRLLRVRRARSRAATSSRSLVDGRGRARCSRS